jgi:hypothetical protein
VRLVSTDPSQALTALALALGLTQPPGASQLGETYSAERDLLADRRVIPLVHLPDLYGASERVRTRFGPPVGRLGEWRFEQVWFVEPARP